MLEAGREDEMKRNQGSLTAMGIAGVRALESEKRAGERDHLRLHRPSDPGRCAAPR
jgi:hypothetical protein